MNPTRPTRLPSLGLCLSLAALLLIPAPSSAEGGSLSELIGRWSRPMGQKVDQAADDHVVVEGRWILDGAWLELDLGRADAARRRSGERLLLRQATAGGVVAYVFTADRELPLRLKGGWTPDGALELTAESGAPGLVWRRDSACKALLIREGEFQLTRAGCGPEASGAAVATAPSPGRGIDADGRSFTPEAAESGSEPVRVSELPAAQPPAATSATSEEQPDLVIVAGNGEPYDEVKKAVERLTDFFASQGVRVTGPSDEIVVLQAAGSSLTYLVQQARDRGAASLLYVTAAFGGRERVIVDCYNRDGARIWREKVVGGTAMRKFRWMNPNLMERIEKKLEPRIGGPGLPVADRG